jgi:hypothetical protein
MGREIESGVDVIITFFCDSRQFSAKKMAFFLKTNVLIRISQKVAVFCTKRRPFFRQIFLAKMSFIRLEQRRELLSASRLRDRQSSRLRDPRSSRLRKAAASLRRGPRLDPYPEAAQAFPLAPCSYGWKPMDQCYDFVNLLAVSSYFDLKYSKAEKKYYCGFQENRQHFFAELCLPYTWGQCYDHNFRRKNCRFYLHKTNAML